MKMKLNVSYDCGVSYQCDMEIDKEEDIVKMAERALHFDNEGLRWVIQRDDGEYISISLIHKKIMTTIDALRKK